MPVPDAQPVLGREVAEPAGFENPEDLVEHPLRVRNVLVDVGAGDEVELALGKRQLHRVADPVLDVVG